MTFSFDSFMHEKVSEVREMREGQSGQGNERRRTMNPSRHEIAKLLSLSS
jgi:hypothetical protein